MEDAGLLGWIGEQNSAQGVAPPPQFVWERRCALAIDNQSGRERGAASWRPARSAAAKKWMQRFRQRWNLTLGRLPAKNLLPSATMQTKARPESRRKVAAVVPPSVAFWGPQGSPRLGAVRSFSVRQWGCKNGTIFLVIFRPRTSSCWAKYHLVLGAWCQVLGAWCQVLGAWCSVLGAGLGFF